MNDKNDGANWGLNLQPLTITLTTTATAAAGCSTILLLYCSPMLLLLLLYSVPAVYNASVLTVMCC